VNGVATIHELFKLLNEKNVLKGTIIGIPVMNVGGYVRFTREYIDGQDLNRIMPGDPKGNIGNQYASMLWKKIVSKFDYFIDLHTASFGNVNSLYVRADMTCKKCCKMAKAQKPQIIMHGKPLPGFLRGVAQRHDIASITVELGNPQVLTPDFIQNTVAGILRFLKSIKVVKSKVVKKAAAKQPRYKTVTCKKGYWIYTNKGGLLRVKPKLHSMIKKGELIATLTDLFGKKVQNIYSPENGIVISKSSNPVCVGGCRIIQLGVVAKGNSMKCKQSKKRPFGIDLDLKLIEGNDEDDLDDMVVA